MKKELYMYWSKYCVRKVVPDQGVTQLFQGMPCTVFEQLSPVKQSYKSYW